MAATPLQIITRGLVDQGLTIDAIARESGVPAEVIEAGVAVDYSVGAAVWKAGAALLDDPVVGLTVARTLPPDRTGALGVLALASRTFGEAITAAAWVLTEMIPGSSFEANVEDEVMRIRYASPRLIGPSYRHGVDHIFGSFLVWGRLGTRSLISAEEVRLQVPAPEPAIVERYEAFFGVKPRWNTSETSLALPIAACEREMHGADPELVELISGGVRQLVGQIAPREKLTRRVRRGMDACIASNENIRVDIVAKRLGMSARSLQRQLAEHELLFRELAGLHLRETADQLLMDSALTIDAIAESLGYSDRSSFERAYRRWAGASPAQKRKLSR